MIVQALLQIQTLKNLNFNLACHTQTLKTSHCMVMHFGSVERDTLGDFRSLCCLASHIKIKLFNLRIRRNVLGQFLSILNSQRYLKAELVFQKQGSRENALKIVQNNLVLIQTTA